MRYTIATFPSSARGPEPDPPPTLFVNQFASVSDAPLTGDEWSTGEARVVRDVTTSDLLWFVANSTTNIDVYSSQDSGDTWSLVESQAVGSSNRNRILAVCQDSTGAVHVLSKDTGGSDTFNYMRLSVTRSGGHVTAIGIAQAPFTLPDHNHGGSDHRGSIITCMRNGSERVLWVYGCAVGTAGDTWTAYSGVSNTLTPASLTDFDGLDGTGDETAVYTYTGDSFGHWHRSEILVAQNAANEDLYFGIGRLNGDHRSVEGADTDQDLKIKRYTQSGGNWTAGSTTTVATDDGSVPPMILDMKGTANRAWIMYYDPAAGIKFGYFDSSGTLNTSDITSPATQTGRAAFGAFSPASDDSKLWAIWHTYWLPADQQRLGGLGYWNGTTWNTTADASPQDCNGIATIDNWPSGVCAVRFTGALLPQSMSAVDIASIYGT